MLSNGLYFIVKEELLEAFLQGREMIMCLRFFLSIVEDVLELPGKLSLFREQNS